MPAFLHKSLLRAGGFGREIQWLIERRNAKEAEWEILGYIDDGVAKGTAVDGYPVLGSSDDLLREEQRLHVACAVGNAQTRRKIIEKLSKNSNLRFPNLIDPSVFMSDWVELGKGNIICASNILTVDIQIGDFNIINLDCTVGHDARLASYITVYPGVNISGCVTIGEFCEIGTGTQIIQGKQIVHDVILGAGSVVVKDILESGTYVGAPAKRIK